MQGNNHPQYVNYTAFMPDMLIQNVVRLPLCSREVNIILGNKIHSLKSIPETRTRNITFIQFKGHEICMVL